MCDSIYVNCPEQANPQRQEAGEWLWGWGAEGLTPSGDEVSFWGDENIVTLIEVMVAQHCGHTTKH